MKFTDKEAIRIYGHLKCYELTESLDEMSETDIRGRCDLQVLADEINYFRRCYEEDGHALCDSLNEAKELLSETRYGKRIPMDARTNKPKHGYWPSDIQSAKDIIAEYRQLQYYEKKLAEKGYRGKW